MASLGWETMMPWAPVKTQVLFVLGIVLSRWTPQRWRSCSMRSKSLMPGQYFQSKDQLVFLLLLVSGYLLSPLRVSAQDSLIGQGLISCLAWVIKSEKLPHAHTLTHSHTHMQSYSSFLALVNRVSFSLPNQSYYMCPPWPNFEPYNAS